MIKSNTNPIFDFALLNTESCVNEIINIFKDKKEEYNKIKYDEDNLLEFYKDSVIIDLYCTVNKNRDSSNTKVYFNQEAIFSLYTNKYFHDYVIKGSISLEKVSNIIRVDIDRKIQKKIIDIKLRIFKSKANNYIAILKDYPSLFIIMDTYSLIESTHRILFTVDYNPFMESLNESEELLRKEIIKYYKLDQFNKKNIVEYSDKEYIFSKFLFEYITSNKSRNIYLLNSKIGAHCVFFAIKYKIMSQEILDALLEYEPGFYNFFRVNNINYTELINLLKENNISLKLTKKYYTNDYLPLDFPVEFLKFAVRLGREEYKENKLVYLDEIVEKIFSGIPIITFERFYYITKDDLIKDILKNQKRYLNKYKVIEQDKFKSILENSIQIKE